MVFQFNKIKKNFCLFVLFTFKSAHFSLFAQCKVGMQDSGVQSGGTGPPFLSPEKIKRTFVGKSQYGTRYFCPCFLFDEVDLTLSNIAKKQSKCL